GNVKLNVGPVTGGVGDEPLLPEQPAASVRAVRSARTGRILRGRCDMLPPVFPKPGGEGSRPDQSSTIPMRRVHSAFPHGAHGSCGDCEFGAPTVPVHTPTGACCPLEGCLMGAPLQSLHDSQRSEASRARALVHGRAEARAMRWAPATFRPSGE